MEKIDLKDYIPSGEGANGVCLYHVSDPTEMVKLYNADYPTDTIFTELEVAKKVHDFGVPSPKPGVLVTDGERYGIKFSRIAGKRSFSRMLADEPERTEEFSREFASYCRKLHQMECPDGLFPDAKPQYFTLLEADKAFNEAEKQKMADFIESVPDSKTALHGDMHIGNIVSTLPQGAPISTPHDIQFIDLGYFSRGCNLFDLGMTMNICLTADEEFRLSNMHVPGTQTAKVWEYFVDEYFEGKLSVEEANDLVMPYQALKLLLVEYNLGFMPEHYKEIIKKALL